MDINCECSLTFASGTVLMSKALDAHGLKDPHQETRHHQFMYAAIREGTCVVVYMATREVIRSLGTIHSPGGLQRRVAFTRNSKLKTLTPCFFKSRKSFCFVRLSVSAIPAFVLVVQRAELHSRESPVRESRVLATCTVREIATRPAL